MKRNIRVEKITQVPIEQQEIELVERKGIGHPDSICDGVAEAVSRALSREYLKRFGRILHHNTDQVELVGGEAAPTFGGGEVIRPMYLLLSGRATTYVGDEKVPVGRIALDAAREYLAESIKNLETSHMVIDQRLGQGSADLVDVFERSGVPKANDTSFGVGHAPFSELERIVHEVEGAITNDLSKKQPAIGEDIKVMGLREGDNIHVTVANALVSRYVDDLEHYMAIKEMLRKCVQEVAEQHTKRKVSVAVNVADDYERGCVYLTVTGTSAEMGDDGSVGRGNRCNGLITPNRPMSMEATSGKNPVNHIGKIYNLLANQIAHDMVGAIDGIEEVYIRILSQIGQPIDNPKVASAQIIPKKGANMSAIKPKAETVIDEWLSDISKITEMVIKGELMTF
ncbi:MAG: methionine adenosyltransferase [Methanocellales archaeon]|nr:methionine adenosyltransferase [Methanocellales archaeon]